MRIRVRGVHRAEYAPQRGTVHLLMALEGRDQGSVVRGVTTLVARMDEKVRAGHRPDSGPITWYSQGQLRNAARRPWNQDGKQLPLVYSSQAEMKVKFSRLEQLFPFIEEVSAWDGVVVAGVEWALTEATRTTVTEQAQLGAVADASAKARRYAGAAGQGNVRALVIADVGLLPDGPGQTAVAGTGSASRARGPAGAAGADAGRTFSPEDVVIECSVEVEFTTDAE